MRFESFLYTFISTILTNFNPVDCQSKECLDILSRKDGMSDLTNFGCKLVGGTLTLKILNICEGDPCPGLGGNSICNNGNCFDQSKSVRPKGTSKPSRPKFAQQPLVPVTAQRTTTTTTITTTTTTATTTARKIQVTTTERITTAKTTTKKPVRGSGKLDIQIIRAEIPDTDVGFASEPDAYAVICVRQGDLVRESVSTPLSPRDRCNCRTGKIDDQNNPVWNVTCEQTWDVHKNEQNTTIITAELYDEDITTDDFVAGGDVSVLDVIRQGKNGKEFELDLTGPFNAKIVLNATWKSIR